MSEPGAESRDERGERESAGDDPTDGSGEATPNSPGGGPKRVVSKTSVDDILASLDDTASSDPSPAVSRTSAAEPTTLESTHGNTDSSSEANADTAAADADGDSATDAETDVDEQSGDSSGVDGEASRPSAVSAETDSNGDPSGELDSDPESGSGSGSTSAVEDEPTVEVDGESGIDTEEVSGEPKPPSEATLPVEDGPEPDAALADRIDRGSVTGADVRAAEAGDGRKATPDIDEIELSLDDLEGSQSASTPDAADRGSDAGPLAGTLEPSDGRDDDSTELDSVARAGSGTRTGDGDKEDVDESPGGIVGRIRRLFSS